MKIVSSVTVHPQTLFAIESIINFQTYYLRKIQIVNIKITKIRSQAACQVLNVNLGSEIS